MVTDPVKVATSTNVWGLYDVDVYQSASISNMKKKPMSSTTTYANGMNSPPENEIDVPDKTNLPSASVLSISTLLPFIAYTLYSHCPPVSQPNWNWIARMGEEKSEGGYAHITRLARRRSGHVLR
jgi:hypothetical protein